MRTGYWTEVQFCGGEGCTLVQFFGDGHSLQELLQGRFTLAPAYDMLPMVWKPDALQGAQPYQPFQPDYSAASLSIRQAAQRF